MHAWEPNFVSWIKKVLYKNLQNIFDIIINSVNMSVTFNLPGTSDWQFVRIICFAI